MDDFLIRALIAGLGVAAVAGPLGCFIVWRRMAYFGDSMAHSALLGIALGLLTGIDVTLGIIGTGIVLAIILVLLQRQRHLSTDTLLGILSHAALSLGLITISLMERLRVDLLGYLFGDILAVTTVDIYWIYGGGVVTLACMAVLWRSLIAMTVHEELAEAEGVHILPARLIFMLLIAFIIAVSIKVVGVLLISSLLIIPAATSRRFARTPETMAAIASFVGMLAVFFGLAASIKWDTPSGPSIVIAATTLFTFSFVFGLGKHLIRFRSPN
jgi:zinc transport system permease protein